MFPETEEMWQLAVGEPIHAWRVWAVAERRGLTVLESITYQVAWPRRKPMRAHCMRQWAKQSMTAGPHSAPIERGGGCACGIYALTELDRCRQWSNTARYPYVNPHSGRARVAGEVALWGRIAQHERGFRAEYAYPLHLTIFSLSDADPDDLTAWLEDGYGVPVTVNTSLL